MILTAEIKVDGALAAHVVASTMAKLETGVCLWDWRVYQEPNRLIGGTELRHDPKEGAPALLGAILEEWKKRGGRG